MARRPTAVDPLAKDCASRQTRTQPTCATGRCPRFDEARFFAVASRISGRAAIVAEPQWFDRYRFSRSQRAMISSAPHVSLRSFSAMTVFSETVAFFTLRSKTFIF